MTNWKLKKLTTLGKDYRCEFLLPPFDKNIDEAAYDITEFKNTPAFQTFLTHINSLEIVYEYAKRNERMFMVIKVGNE